LMIFMDSTGADPLVSAYTIMHMNKKKTTLKPRWATSDN